MLTGSLNDLIETVDLGLGETAGVLAALASTGLTSRVVGEYHGASYVLMTQEIFWLLAAFLIFRHPVSSGKRGGTRKKWRSYSLARLVGGAHV